MGYQGHCRSCSMLVIHRHTCFNLYSSGTQFTFLLYCSCMLLNAYHLCNVYVTNKCCVASASGPKDRKLKPQSISVNIIMKYNKHY